MAAADGSVGFDEPFFVQAARARALNVLPPEDFYRLPAEKRAMAFTVSGLARLDQVQAVADSLARATDEGWSFERWQEWATDQDWSLPQHRIETIYRTNIQTAYMAGHWRNFEMSKRTRPWLMFDAINDSRVRPNHLALDGVIRHVDDPVWDKISPPLGWNCRCTLRSLTDLAAQKRGGRTGTIPADGHADGPGWGKRPLMRSADIAGYGEQRAAQSDMAGQPEAMADLARAFTGADPGRVTSEMLRDAVGDQLWDAILDAIRGRSLPPEFAGLTEAERAALHLWTLDVAQDAWFRRVNTFLRTPSAPADPELLPVIAAIRSGIVKLPAVRGRLLFRAEKVFPPDTIEDVLSRFPEGAEVALHGFTATTIDPQQMLRGAIRFVIEGRNGRWIAPLSDKRDQAEVLFDAGSVFVVRSVIRTPTGATIWLSQL
ncbi:MAG: hypothetical protein D6811_05080 [Alphaproteobacteria bacterium]|nr:MAG: hypothetical protein D6811_05080 [Alphaproteobacteria bacterium]